MSADYPCECERKDLDRDLRKVLIDWMAGNGVHLDSRADFDLSEECHRVTGALEYGLCHTCAEDEKRAEQADNWWEG